jgi:hypothetical protein
VVHGPLLQSEFIIKGDRGGFGLACSDRWSGRVAILLGR